MDFFNPFGDDTETMLIIYAVCHMTGMSSACANPLLYGWLNDNFRKEFREIGTSVCRCPAENPPPPPAESKIPPTLPKDQSIIPDQSYDPAAMNTVVKAVPSPSKLDAEIIVAIHATPPPLRQVDSSV